MHTHTRIYTYHFLKLKYNTLPNNSIYRTSLLTQRKQRKDSLQRWQRILIQKQKQKTTEVLNHSICAGLKRNYDETALRKKRWGRITHQEIWLWLESSTFENFISNMELF